MKRPPPALTNAQISSHSWLMSDTRSGRPSPSKSAGTRVDAAREPLQHVRHEAPAAGVLEPAGLAVVVAEAGDADVEIAVGVEIRRARVGDARHAVHQRAGGEALAAVVLQHDDGADAGVVGMQEAEGGHQQIEIAVAIDVHRFDVRRGGHAGDRLLGEGAARRLPHPRDQVAEPVADEDVGQAVAVEIGDGDVGDHRALFALRRQADRAPGEERGGGSGAPGPRAGGARGASLDRSPPHAATLAAAHTTAAAARRRLVPRCR